MSIDYTKGDLLPAYEDVLLGGQSPYDLSGCTVRFVAKNQSTGAELFDRGAVVVDAPGGRVRYEPAAGDTDTVGRFLAQWVVTTAEGKRRTFPTDFLLFQVHESADADASGGAPPTTVSSVSVYGWAAGRSSGNVALSGLPVGGDAGDPWLLTEQDDPVQNGLWILSAGAWTRPANGDLFPGAMVFVASENAYWLLDADEVPAVGTDAQVWVEEVIGIDGTATEEPWTMPLVVNRFKRMTFDGGPVAEVPVPLALSGHSDGATATLWLPPGSLTDTDGLRLAPGLNAIPSGIFTDPVNEGVLLIVDHIGGEFTTSQHVITARDLTVPTLLSASVESAAPSVLELTFSLPVYLPSHTGVTLAFSVGTSRTVVGIASGLGSTVVRLTLSGSVSASDVFTVSIAAGVVQAMNGPALASVSGFAVTNNTGELVLPSTIFRWRGASLGADGSAISSVPDISGNGNTINYAGTQPTVYVDATLNGQKVIRFDGVSNQLKMSTDLLVGGGAVPDYASFTTIIVFRSRNASGDSIFVSAADATGNEFTHHDVLRETGQLYFAVADGTAPGRATGADSSTSWRWLVAEHTGAARRVLLNGVLFASNAVSKNPAALRRVSVGAGYQTGVYKKELDVAEILCFGDAFTGYEAMVASYMAARYGL